MAATTLALQQIKAVGTISGNQFRVSPPYDLNAGQTIHAYDVVVLATGKASVSASPVPASNTVLGVAIHGAKQGTAWYLVPEDGSGTLQQEDTGGTYGGTFMGSAQLMGSLEGTGVHVMDANPDTIFQVSLTQPIGLTAIGLQTGILQDATTKVWYADTSNATKSALIIGIPNFVGVLYPAGPVNPIPATYNTTGDVNYPVWIQFLPTATALGI